MITTKNYSIIKRQKQRALMQDVILKRAKLLFIEYIVCLLIGLGVFFIGSVGSLDSGDFLPAGAYCLIFMHLGFLTFLPYDSPFLVLLFGLVIVGTPIVCILAYLIRPNKITAVISFLGIAMWLFLGLVAGVFMGV